MAFKSGFEPLLHGDMMLLIQWNVLFIWDLHSHIVDGVARLNFQRDDFVGQGQWRILVWLREMGHMSCNLPWHWYRGSQRLGEGAPQVVLIVVFWYDQLHYPTTSLRAMLITILKWSSSLDISSIMGLHVYAASGVPVAVVDWRRLPWACVRTSVTSKSDEVVIKAVNLGLVSHGSESKSRNQYWFVKIFKNSKNQNGGRYEGFKRKDPKRVIPKKEKFPFWEGLKTSWKHFLKIFLFWNYHFWIFPF